MFVDSSQVFQSPWFRQDTVLYTLVKSGQAYETRPANLEGAESLVLSHGEACPFLRRLGVGEVVIREYASLRSSCSLEVVS